MSRFACQALAVHSHWSSGNLDALRFQSRIQGPRDWQLHHRIVRYGITVLIQSCSVTTSTLTPLVVVGHLRLVKVYPFTAGANVRTTVTGFRHDSCAVSPLLRTGMSAHLVPTAIWSGLRTFDVEILGKHRSRHRFFSSLVHFVHVRRDSCHEAGILPGEPLEFRSRRDRVCSVSHCSLAFSARGDSSPFDSKEITQLKADVVASLRGLGLQIKTSTDDSQDVLLDYRFLELLLAAARDPDVSIGSFASGVTRGTGSQTSKTSSALQGEEALESAGAVRPSPTPRRSAGHGPDLEEELSRSCFAVRRSYRGSGRSRKERTGTEVDGV